MDRFDLYAVLAKASIEITTAGSPEGVVSVSAFCSGDDVKPDLALQVVQVRRTWIEHLDGSAGCVISLQAVRDTFLNDLCNFRKCRCSVRGRELNSLVLGR